MPTIIIQSKKSQYKLNKFKSRILKLKFNILLFLDGYISTGNEFVKVSNVPYMTQEQWNQFENSYNNK